MKTRLTSYRTITNTFEKLMENLEEGKYKLEEATYDVGLYRTVFVVSVMKQNKEGV